MNSTTALLTHKHDPLPQGYELLHARLREMPFDGFAALMARLLPKLGYQDVRLTGRRDFKGRNGRDGTTGYDLTATQRDRTVLIQLKQFPANQALFQRSFDELRGVTLRSGAAEALLITTGSFSPSVDRDAHRLAPITPITTVSGEELVALMYRYRVGVTDTGEINEALFARLHRDAKGNRPGDCTGTTSFVVTVGVTRAPRKKRPGS